MKKFKLSHKSLDKDGYKAEKKRKIASNDRRITKIDKQEKIIVKPLINKVTILNTHAQENNMNVVYGTHSVLSVLRDTPKLIEKIYVRDGLANKDLPIIYDLCKTHKIPVSNIPDSYKMTELAGTSAHQGLVVIMRDFEYKDIDEMLTPTSAPRLFIILDEIEDPHNVGAIVRSAVAVGATGIIVPKHRQAPINGSVYKASAGLVNQIPIARVSNIGVAIEKLKKSHVWVGALGMQASPTTSPPNEGGATQNTFWSLDLIGDLAIVVGNEANGIQAQHIKDSDFTISIPMSEKAESLNASVAAAIAMYEWKRQNML